MRGVGGAANTGFARTGWSLHQNIYRWSARVGNLHDDSKWIRLHFSTGPGLWNTGAGVGGAAVGDPTNGSSGGDRYL